MEAAKRQLETEPVGAAEAATTPPLDTPFIAHKRAEVVVFPPIGKGAEFMAWQPERIPEDQRNLIAQALAVRYPEVAD